jgi:hypothetical protein
MTLSEAVVWEGFVTLEVPQDWAFSDEDGTISIFRSDGVGALQLSFATHQPPADLERLTLDLARKVRLEANPVKSDLELGGVPTAYVEGYSCDAERSFWRIWHTAVSEGRVARVTYTCVAEDSSIERHAVDTILSTCRWMPPARHP